MSQSELFDARTRGRWRTREEDGGLRLVFDFGEGLVDVTTVVDRIDGARRGVGW